MTRQNKNEQPDHIARSILSPPNRIQLVPVAGDPASPARSFAAALRASIRAGPLGNLCAALIASIARVSRSNRSSGNGSRFFMIPFLELHWLDKTTPARNVPPSARENAFDLKLSSDVDRIGL
jgi:hypothetical protein